MFLMLLLGGCQNTLRKESSEIKSHDDLNSNLTNLTEVLGEVVTTELQITFFSAESRVGIDGQEGIFIFAEITNKSQTVIYPENSWGTYVAVLNATSESDDSLYPGVLTKKDLDGSPYKKAIDMMSRPLNPGEKAIVGFFCVTGGQSVEIVLFNEDHVETRRKKIEL